MLSVYRDGNFACWFPILFFRKQVAAFNRLRRWGTGLMLLVSAWTMSTGNLIWHWCCVCVLVLCQSEVLGPCCATCSDLAVPFDRRAGYWQKVDGGLGGTISQVCSLAVCLWVWVWMWMSVSAIQTYHLLFGALWVFQTLDPKLSAPPHDLNTWSIKNLMQDILSPFAQHLYFEGVNTITEKRKSLRNRLGSINTQRGLMGLESYQMLWRLSWT